MEYKFDVKETAENCIAWIRNWFNENGNENTKAVIGISGGKDSTVVAGLLCKALGPERVVGVMMPNIKQADINDSYSVIEYLGIDEHYVINIGKAYEALTEEIRTAAPNGVEFPSPTYATNTPARLRMTTLYGIGAQIGNCRVVNTCNLSEDVLGYSTFYGDSAGDFAPIRYLTTEEVVAIGDYLGLPIKLTHKTPSDGMCGKSDEDNLGFTYKEVNQLIREDVKGPNLEAIEKKYLANVFKTSIINIPGFRPNLPNYFYCD